MDLSRSDLWQLIYFGLPLVQQERVEGCLLIFLGLLAGYRVHVSKKVNLCPTCGGWLKNVSGPGYCRSCSLLQRRRGYSQAHDIVRP
ncbi:MAG: hypothetical protein QXK38_03160 [Candidatus Caldarchaeum sp.]